jgi:hypothetical protein
MDPRIDLGEEDLLAQPGIEPQSSSMSIVAVITELPSLSYVTLARNKLRGLSPRENYTDRVTAACRRS